VNQFLHFVKYRLQPITPPGPAKTRHGPNDTELICYSLVNDFTWEQCGTSTDDASNNSLLDVIVNMSVRRQPAHLLERLPIIVHSRSRRHRQPTRCSSVVTLSSRSITVVVSLYSITLLPTDDMRLFVITIYTFPCVRWRNKSRLKSHATFLHK